MAQYTDAEMLLAAQISYMDIPPGMSVEKAIEATINQYQDNCVFWSKEWWQLQWAEGAKKIIEQNNLTSYKNWTIKDVCDNENGSGFYGCLINTGDGNAIVGCRGSEQYLFGGQIARDWRDADLGLLNSALTAQQADATNYMQYLYDNYGDSYLSFSITGHSLGGNLAEHCAVTAPAGMVDKIDHVINYDGPGYSNEYIAMYRDDIARVSDRIDHYQHSFVGSLLTSLPGVDRQVINAQDDPRAPGIFGTLLKHDASNIIMENGHVQPGDPDGVQNFLGPASRVIDYLGPGIFLLVPGIGPKLFIDSVNHMVEGALNAMVEKVTRRGRDVYDAISNFLGRVIDKYFGHEASGEFEVNLSSLQVFPDELESIAGRSEDIADDIRTIVSSLKYHSISGAYYKNKLRRIARNIEKAGRFARNSGNVLSDVISLYRTRDADVAASYT